MLWFREAFGLPSLERREMGGADPRQFCMKAIVAGSRNVTSYDLVCRAIVESEFEITEIVSGGARGVDALGEKYAIEHGINCRVFKAQWDTYGKRAGPMRNYEMAKYADALIAVWDGLSRGTSNMIGLARREGLKVHVMLTMPSDPEIDFYEGLK